MRLEVEECAGDSSTPCLRGAENQKGVGEPMGGYNALPSALPERAFLPLRSHLFVEAVPGNRDTFPASLGRRNFLSFPVKFPVP